jgi:xylulokinase
VRPGTGFVSLGTSGVVFVPSETLEIDPSGALHAFCHAVPGQYHLMGVMLSAAGSLRWYRDVIAADQAADAEARGVDVYDELLASAAEIEPGAEGLHFLPYLAGERTPHMDPFARGGWVGLTLAHDRRHLVRALIEGVSFGLKDSLVLMEQLGVSPAALYAVGGGARNAVWRQVLASILGVPLQRLQVEEGPALGAALLASVGAGVHADVGAAVNAAVRLRGEPDRPDPTAQARYQELHGEFTKLHPSLRATAIWHPG